MRYPIHNSTSRQLYALILGNFLLNGTQLSETKKTKTNQRLLHHLIAERLKWSQWASRLSPPDYYPKVQPTAARQLARDAFQLIAIGKDPQSEKVEKRQAARLRDLASFEQAARDWHKHATATHEWTAGYSHRVLRMIKLHAFPRLGKLPIELITTADVLDSSGVPNRFAPNSA